MNKQYFEVLGRLRAKHGTRFNPPQGVDHLIPYFGMRRVEGTGQYEVRRGRIGITTGWAPALLLLHNATSIGSSDLLGPDDKVTAIITPSSKRIPT